MRHLKSTKITHQLLLDPDIHKAVQDEIGDLLYEGGFELIPNSEELRPIMIGREFTERSGLVDDWVKYIVKRKARIHVKKIGKKGNCYYHLDKH